MQPITTPDVAGFSGDLVCRLAPSLANFFTGENNLPGPLPGIAAFCSAVAILLSLLIFIGEAVRDAFADPAKAV